MKALALPTMAALAVGLLLGVQLAPRTAPAPAGSSCATPASRMARVEILFGMSQPNDVPIPDPAWEAFLDTEVTPRFPSGFTVLRGAGQWRGGTGHITKEKSAILVVWHHPTAELNADVEAIRAAYKARFQQESVMRVDSTSCVSF